MSKFQVTKKDFLRYASTHSGAKNLPATMAENKDDQEVDLITDLRNEKDSKWRREVLQKLRQKDEETEEKNQKSSSAPADELTAPTVRKRRRIDMLAEPRVRFNGNDLPEPFRVRRSALICNASDRIQDLAMPKRIHARPLTKQQSEPPSASESKEDAYQRRQPFEISERLKSLAQPRRNAYEAAMALVSDCYTQVTPTAHFTYDAQDSAETRTNRMARLLELTKIPRHKLSREPAKHPGAVAYSALVCRASPRVEELAGPRIRREARMNEFAFKTQPKALRYNPSERIENLAVAKIKKHNVKAL